ncbi:hypothetical protein HPG69_001669 [Diceros bicornis minor]|uniref:Uncharacterized protein n=1 Tax=Diceros bicornis minor TaxID=77932 RepID=A0A7J7FH98_DICBM|nr:hypothetical protein HPG69_001669 [Diceros bicornis minor]
MPAYAGRANPNAPARKGHNQERRPARTTAHARPSKTQTETTTGERTRVVARGFRLGRGRKRVPVCRERGCKETERWLTAGGPSWTWLSLF